MSQVVTGRDQRQFGSGFGPDLADADSGGEAVADAFATVRICHGAAFAEEIGQRLGGTAVADRAIGPAVGMAQVAEVADPGTVFVVRSFREGLRQLSHLEGKSRG